MSRVRTLYAFLACLGLAAADDPGQPRVEFPVWQPGEDRGDHNESADDEPLVPELTVVVTVGDLKDVEPDGEVEARVECVLYGSWGGRTIRIPAAGLSPGRHVLDLTPSRDAAETFAPAQKRVDDEAGLAALSACRFRAACLSSDSIFVAKHLESESRDEARMEVVRTIKGSAVKGARVRVGRLRDAPGLRNPSPWGDELLVFADPWGTRDGDARYGAVHVQPAVRADAAAEALARRTGTVLHRRGLLGDEDRWVEVVFDGPIEDAWRMVASPDREIGTMAARALFHRASIPELEKAIAARIDRLATTAPRADDGLPRLIAVLGDRERETPTGAIDRLVGVWEASMDAGGAGPAPDETPPEYFGCDPDGSRTNHPLTHLLYQLPEDHAVAKHGRRLLERRANSTGGWRAELDFALSVTRIEEALAVSDAEASVTKPAPRHWVRSEGDQFSFFGFTSDGASLMVEVRGEAMVILDAGTFAERRRVKIPDGCRVVSAHPEGSAALVERIGKEGNTEDLILLSLADGRAVAHLPISGNRRDRAVAWSPDGKLALFSNDGIREYFLTHGGLARNLAVESFGDICGGYADDGRSMVWFSQMMSSRRCHVTDLSSAITTETDAVFQFRVELAAGGRFIVDHGSGLTFHDRVTFKPVWQHRLPRCHVGSTSFSADATRFAAFAVPNIRSWQPDDANVGAGFTAVVESATGKIIFALRGEAAGIAILAPGGNRVCVSRAAGLSCWPLK